MKVVYSILALVLGAGLIIAGFMVLGQNLDENVRTLDIVVSIVLYSQIALVGFMPIINRNKKEQREVGMMGIHYVVLYGCIIASLAIMAIGILQDVSFTYQLMLQLVVLMALLLGRVITLRAGDQVAQVYHEEKSAMRGRQSLASAVQDLQDAVCLARDVPETARQRINSLQESVRYLTPNASAQAGQVEHLIGQEIGYLKSLLRDARINAPVIDETLNRINHLMEKRRNIHD